LGTFLLRVFPDKKSEGEDENRGRDRLHGKRN